MIQYLVKRFILIIPTFLGVTVVVFFFTRIMPGGPIETFLMEIQQNAGSSDGHSTPSSNAQSHGSGVLSEDQLQILKEFYGYDKPWYTAYWLWLNKVIRLDFGNSTRYQEPVWDMIKERLPVSNYYGIMTFLITYLVCIPLGIARAFKHGSAFDITSSILTYIGYAIPSYVVAIVLLVTFGAKLEWFPMMGFMSEDLYGEPLGSFAVIKSILYHSILPMIAYLANNFAILSYELKSYLMEEIAQDYVRTAVAKGVNYRDAVLRHAIRNSIIPLAGAFSSMLLVWLSGSYLVEVIFNIDGLGLLFFEATINRDVPVMMASAAISGMLSLIGMIITDLVVAIIDPRVSYT